MPSISSQLGSLQLGAANLGSIHSNEFPVAGLSLSDDLAQPWTDAQRLFLGLRLTGETITLTDAFAYTYLAPSVPLSVVIVDKIIRNGSINGNNFALRDGLVWVLLPDGPVNIAVSDLGTFFDDANLSIGYGLSVSD